jgi:hypothetical protein
MMSKVKNTSGNIVVIGIFLTVIGIFAALGIVAVSDSRARTSSTPESAVRVSIEEGGNIAFPNCDYAVVVENISFLIRRTMLDDKVGFEIMPFERIGKSEVTAFAIPFGSPNDKVEIVDGWQFVPAVMGMYGSASQFVVLAGGKKFVFMLITGNRPQSMGMVVDRVS